MTTEEVVACYRERGLTSRMLRCRWAQTVEPGATYRQRVLPDGCADVLVDQDGHAVAVGPTARHAVVGLPAGAAYECLRLRPWAVPFVLGVPADRLLDEVVPLGDVVDIRTREHLIRAAHGEGRAMLEMERRWDDIEVDQRVTGALRWLHRHAVGDIAQLAREVGLSPRQLRRLLVEHTGLGPKALQRIFRLHRFLRAAETDATVALADLAALTGFADQAHLSRDVQALSGLAPAALLKERAGLSTT